MEETHNIFQGQFIKKDGKLIACSPTDIIYKNFIDSLQEGQKISIFMDSNVDNGTLAQIAKIRSTQYESSAPPASEIIPTPSTGGADSGGNGNAVPQFNPLDLAFLNNRPEQTPRAFVLAGDVQSGIQARDRVEELARL